MYSEIQGIQIAMETAWKLIWLKYNKYCLWVYLLCFYHEKWYEYCNKNYFF